MDYILNSSEIDYLILLYFKECGKYYNSRNHSLKKIIETKSK